MIFFVFFTLFGLNMVFPSEGLVKDGDKIVFASGTLAKLQWQFDIKDVSKVAFRAWQFTSSDGTLSDEYLATINQDKDPVIASRHLTGVKVEKPATLILKNVNESYDGLYTFTLTAGSKGGAFKVTVLIAVTPTVTVECSRVTTVNKGDDVTCVCRGEGGKPPANVTWYKDGVKISETGKESQKLRRSNVHQTDSGRYTCVAESHEKAKNKTSFELVVNFPPENVRVVLPSEIAVRGNSLTIKCEAEAEPPPTFKIFFNETEVLISGDNYTILKVNDSHVGFYKCLANNTLGLKISSPRYLRVGNAGTHGNDGDDAGLSTGAIVGIIIGVLVLVLVVAIVCLLKLKKKNHGHERVKNDSPMKTPSGSTSNQPHEYAVLEKPEPVTYAALDKQDLKKGGPEKPARTHTPTEYADIQVS